MNSARQRKDGRSPLDPATFGIHKHGKDCAIWPEAQIIGGEYISLGNAVMIDDFAFIHAKNELIIGDFVHIGAYSSITGGEDCWIGAFTSLSWGVRVFTSTEGMAGLFGPMIPADLRGNIHAPVIIGKHVLIGANSVILPGATIHDGAVIGAGSVVRKNKEIPKWEVWGGVPARHIKGRYWKPVVMAERELRERYDGQL